MRKVILICMLLFGVYITNGQIGIGTSSPDESAVLEVKSNDKGVLTPRLTEIERDNISDPAKGLIIYNLTNDCLQINSGLPASPDWDCIGADKESIIGVLSDCDVNGFEGSYQNGVGLTSANKFSITITNNTFSVITMTLNVSDLVLNGISGVNVSSVSLGSISLNSGDSQVIEYTLSGTPSSSGTLSGVWTKLGLNCMNVVNVTP